MSNSNAFCINPETGDIQIVADDFMRPNGLAISTDEKLLYIADIGRSPDPVVSDGFRTDIYGNVWVIPPKINGVSKENFLGILMRGEFYEKDEI